MTDIDIKGSVNKSDIVKLYNPANAAALNADQIAGLQKLTDSELKELAKAYPNSAFTKNYLLIIDTKKNFKNHLPVHSSFQSLYNLRNLNGMKSYVAFGFKGVNVPVKKPIAAKGKRKVEVLDLSDAELLTLPGFKSIPIASVPVKKVGKKLPIDQPVINEIKTQ